jgi:hypothetical protein
MDYVAIDFEASCLPRHGRSFPIEVAITDQAATRSWLIKPDPLWRDWDWTDEALDLHGIRRDQLDQEGFEPEVVVAELGRSIRGRRVIADSSIDTYWWDTLVDATAVRLPSPIEHVRCVLDELGATSEQIFSAQGQADRLCPARHRAAADARWLWTLLSKVREAVEECAPSRSWRRSPPPVPVAVGWTNTALFDSC